MRIGSDIEYLEIIEIERLPEGTPCAGDVKVSVLVQFKEFSGKYSEVWLELPVINYFLDELTRLEDSRRGSASIESMSPDEFYLEIRSSDSPGHMEVEVSLQRFQYSGPKYWPIKLSGGFQVEPETINQLIKGFGAFIK